MPKLTVDPRSVLAISPGRLNALRVLEDELQLLRQQSANHPEYLGLMPGMEMEIARIRQATGTAAPEPQPEPELPIEPNSLGLVGKGAALVELIQNGGVTAKQAAKQLGSTPNAIAQYVSRIRKHIDIVNREGVYQIANQKGAIPAVNTEPIQHRVMNYIRAHPEFTAWSIKQDLGLIKNQPYTAIRDATTKYGWKIESTGYGEYKLIKEGRMPGKPGGYRRSKRRRK